jgi:hypothetical protein
MLALEKDASNQRLDGLTSTCFTDATALTG